MGRVGALKRRGGLTGAIHEGKGFDPAVGFSSPVQGSLRQGQGPVAVSPCWGKGCAREPLLGVLCPEGSQMLPGQLRHPPQGSPRRSFWCRDSLCLPRGGPWACRGGLGPLHLQSSPWPRVGVSRVLAVAVFPAASPGAGLGAVSPPHRAPAPGRSSLGQGLGIPG